MKIRLNLANGVWLELDCTNPKEAVKELAAYQEVFSERECGMCHATELVFLHRQDDEKHDYYSIKCKACQAQVDFGQHKTGNTLFLKRKDANGQYDTNHGGWYHWKDRQRDNS